MIEFSYDSQEHIASVKSGNIKMDNETNPNENESEVVKASDEINENGCDEPDEIDGVTETDEKDQNDEQAVEIENKLAEGDEEDEKAISPKEAPIIDESITENDDFAVIDSDNPSECSPEKGQGSACLVSSPSENENDEVGTDKSWNELNDSSPEKSRSEATCVISSPSEVEGEETVNDKGWVQLNESVSEGIYEDSMEEEPESDDDEFINRSSPKFMFKEHEKKQKSAVECPVFELTDDNSSVDDARSDVDDDIEGDEMGEEEEDSGKLINK